MLEYPWGRSRRFLWFDDTAEEAMNFYISIFKNSGIVNVSRHGDAGPGAKGTVMSGTFELESQKFMALNGGPMFTFFALDLIFRELRNAGGSR